MKKIFQWIINFFKKLFKKKKSKDPVVKPNNPQTPIVNEETPKEEPKEEVIDCSKLKKIVINKTGNTYKFKVI